uniref:Uncharacterized protein n=1 Tax=Arundo donax TaxID=35708 RepID=A0A0A9ENG9_ARUDO
MELISEHYVCWMLKWQAALVVSFVACIV